MGQDGLLYATEYAPWLVIERAGGLLAVDLRVVDGGMCHVVPGRRPQVEQKWLPIGPRGGPYLQRIDPPPEPDAPPSAGGVDSEGRREGGGRAEHVRVDGEQSVSTWVHSMGHS